MSESNFSNVKAFLNDCLTGSRDMSTIDVIPLPCGIGKSTYIIELIYNCIQQGKGIIIVTDAIDRMTEYTDRLSQYIRRNIDNYKIAVLTAETYSDEVKKLVYKPVVCMTTQRFFQMTREEIMALTAYTDGKRDTIVFDEQPYLTEVLKIDIGVLDRIDDALHSMIDNLENQDDKQWLIRQWESVTQYIKAKIAEYESQNKNEVEPYPIYHFDRESKVIEDIDKFTSLVSRFKDKLRKYDYRFDVGKYISAIVQLLEEGATFISTKKSKDKRRESEYSNYFLVLRDNRDKLLNLGAKVFVLDGTADISPAYDVDYVRMIDCKQFRRKLDNLTINLVDVRSSKGYLSNDSEKTSKIIDCLISYQNALPDKDEVLFSYDLIEKRYGIKLQSAYDYINHFGNIRGYNTYRECKNIIQFGIHRYQEVYYNLQSGFSTLCKDKGKSDHLVGLEYYKPTMIGYVLADIEQNIFRSKIRNIDCTEPIRYTIFFDYSTYPELIDAIINRYKPMGATIKMLGVPQMFTILKTKNRKTKEDTHAQKIIDWYYNLPQGIMFRAKDIMRECNLSENQYKSAKLNKAVKVILESCSTGNKGVYQVPMTKPNVGVKFTPPPQSKATPERLK